MSSELFQHYQNARVMDEFRSSPHKPAELVMHTNVKEEKQVVQKVPTQLSGARGRMCAKDRGESVDDENKEVGIPRSSNTCRQELAEQQWRNASELLSHRKNGEAPRTSD